MRGFEAGSEHLHEVLMGTEAGELLLHGLLYRLESLTHGRLRTAERHQTFVCDEELSEVMLSPYSAYAEDGTLTLTEYAREVAELVMAGFFEVVEGNQVREWSHEGDRLRRWHFRNPAGEWLVLECRSKPTSDSIGLSAVLSSGKPAIYDASVN